MKLKVSKKIFLTFSFSLVAISVLISVLFFDQSIAFLIHNYNSHFIYNIANFVGVITDKIVVLTALIPLLIFSIFRKKNIQKFAFLTIGFSILMTATLLLKMFLGRSRPQLLIEENINSITFFSLDNLYWGLPSGHTLTALFLAISIQSLWNLSKLSKVLMWGITSVVCLSRIFTAQHFLSDIIITAVFTVVLTVFLLKLYKFTVENKIVNKFLHKISIKNKI
ncbi:MAG: phosphatase PAP2 family protein [Alphaproteobacteria bacterium]|nr:phosphatase PAP2 family protein [Alphaproteobacteria bacterium]MBL0717938.1 phosphatase PAP2 family protein [Alphaproteobacteria bacterium]